MAHRPAASETPSTTPEAGAREALGASWRSWALCLVAPSAWLGYVFYTLPTPSGLGTGSADAAAVPGPSGTFFWGGGGWLVLLGVVWLALMGPAIFVLRSYCFRAAWDGRPVEPASYVRGMASIWAVLVVGAVLALLGSLVSGAWLPGGGVAAVAIGLVLLTRPSGKALGLKG